MQSKELVTLGTDVEFVIEGVDGDFIPAGLALPSDGIIGCDQTGQGAGLRTIGEIRTLPRSDAREIVGDIGRCLRAIDAHFDKHQIKHMVRFLAGHYQHDRSIGGHVHLSSPFFVDPVVETTVAHIHAWCLLMTATFDDAEQVAARHKAGYFKQGGDRWGAVRPQGNGLYGLKYYHFEYRNWGSYLISPLYAYVILSLSKMCALSCMVNSNLPVDKIIKGKLAWDTEDLIALIEEQYCLSEDTADLLTALPQLYEQRNAIRNLWPEDFMDRW
jgi:hypothetical protein